MNNIVFKASDGNLYKLENGAWIKVNAPSIIAKVITLIRRILGL